MEVVVRIIKSHELNTQKIGYRVAFMVHNLGDMSINGKTVYTEARKKNVKLMNKNSLSIFPKQRRQCS